MSIAIKYAIIAICGIIKDWTYLFVFAIIYITEAQPNISSPDIEDCWKGYILYENEISRCTAHSFH